MGIAERVRQVLDQPTQGERDAMLEVQPEAMYAGVLYGVAQHYAHRANTGGGIHVLAHECPERARDLAMRIAIQ